jgi:hypothetical protein
VCSSDLNTTGTNNNASGEQALYGNTSANDNNAMGHAALFNNSTGAGNSGIGAEALFNNTTANDNSAMGREALYSNTTGNFNIGIGYEAGYYLTTGNSNIDIGNRGLAADNGIIRIGQLGTQTQTYIVGVATAPITGAAVYVTANGQLGVLASSERYKTSIAPIGPNTGKLEQLRPVSFHLKTEPNGALQYGLIAEEVDKIYPELVIRDEAGKIQGVRYDELAPMLLNEVQNQQAIIKTQSDRLDELTRQVAQLSSLQQELSAGLQRLDANAALVAKR